jgi:hypothetical protein
MLHADQQQPDQGFLVRGAAYSSANHLPTHTNEGHASPALLWGDSSDTSGIIGLGHFGNSTLEESDNWATVAEHSTPAHLIHEYIGHSAPLPTPMLVRHTCSHPW